LEQTTGQPRQPHRKNPSTWLSYLSNSGKLSNTTILVEIPEHQKAVDHGEQMPGQWWRQFSFLTIEEVKYAIKAMSFEVVAFVLMPKKNSVKTEKWKRNENANETLDLTCQIELSNQNLLPRPLPVPALLRLP